MSRPPAGGTLRLAFVPAVLVVAVVAAVVLSGGRARASEPPETRPSSALHADWQVGPEQPVSDPVYVSAAPSQSLPKIAFDGTNYLVVWQEDRGNQYGDVYASRVAPDGTVLDPHGIAIATARSSELNPAVAFDGTNYLVTWTASTFPDGDIYGARISPSGEVLDPGGFAISTAPGLQDFSALAFDGTNYLVVWMSGHYPADIYAARVTPAGTVLDPDGIPVSTATGEQGLPAVAFDGENYLVAWEDGRNPNSDVYGARVTPTGTVLDPAGVAISSTAGAQWAPKLSFDGTNYLVAWQDGRNGDGSTFDVYGARVSPAGSVLDASGIPISTAPNSQLTPSIAFGGTTFFVVWSDQRSGNGAYGARVSSGGVVLDPSGIPITTSAGSWPAVGFDGTNYLAAWSRIEAGSYKSDLFAGRVSTSGVALDPSGLPIDRLAPSEQQDPVLAYGGTSYLAVWQDYRAGNSDIYAGRLTQQGVLLDGTGIPVAVGVDQQINPTVTFDGAEYLVAWEIHHSDAERDVYGARISPSGTVLDPSGFAISAGVGAQGDPAAASDGSKSLVVWEDSRSSPRPVAMGDGRFGPPPPPPPPPPPRWDVYGTRVDRDGTVLDPSGIPVRSGGADQLDPALAFDGVNYVAVWADGPNYGEDVYGGRVTPGGAVLDPAGIAISTVFGTQGVPAVASAGDGQSLVVWQDDRTLDLDVHGARLGADGTVLDPGDIAISTAVGTQSFPAVAFDGRDYLAGWGDNRDGTDFNPDFKVYGARVGTSGSVLDPSGILIADSPLWSAPSIARGDPGAALTYSRLAGPAYGGATRAFLRLFSEDLPPPPPPPPPPVEPPPPPPPVRCHVPRAIGLRVATAKRKIRRAHCSVGRVRRIHSRPRLRGRVVAQSPRPGAVRRGGYPVRLAVGRR
jgi:hypothetical protein